jgi:multicomponent Na+:H+ antiporter subunit C
METFLAFVIGGLYAAGLYMMMRRNLVRLIIGLALLGQAANLLIFTVGRLTRGQPALISSGSTSIEGPFADPLPQALILTAIVIGFGVQAFALVLFKRVYQTLGTDDLDDLKSTDTN